MNECYKVLDKDEKYLKTFHNFNEMKSFVINYCKRKETQVRVELWQVVGETRNVMSEYWVFTSDGIKENKWFGCS